MNLLGLFKRGLEKTREATAARLSTLLGGGKIDQRGIEELEEILLAADVGVGTVERLMGVAAEAARSRGFGTLRGLIEAELIDTLALRQAAEKRARFSTKPWVITLVGVNGSGKTTTAGKLAYHFGLQGRRSVFAASDTFRAAAIEQVEKWAERSASRVVKQSDGADPAAVAFDAYQSALARSDDALIIDTAGRLQTKQNLMTELAKITRVLRRFDERAPHESLLVIDATTGQNGLSQARAFVEAAQVTGLIVTKLDGTARGGIVIPIQSELGIPVEFVGMGEDVKDLYPFDARDYVQALLGG